MTVTEDLDSDDELLLRCDSYERTRELLLAMFRARSPEACIGLFLRWFNVCDAPWVNRSHMANRLRWALAQVPLRDVLPSAERTWYDAMDPLMLVYRGCEAGRERGLSWTTNINVARGFAEGKRCRYAMPTMVSAFIPKEHVFAVFLSRQEDEVIVDPRRLRRLMIVSQTTRAAANHSNQS